MSLILQYLHPPHFHTLVLHFQLLAEWCAKCISISNSMSMWPLLSECAITLLERKPCT